MLYLCLAMLVDIAIFTTGLTMSIIDVNRYNFGLYLVLMSAVTFSLLVALWVAKPKCCRTPNWAINIYHILVKSSRPNYQTGGVEAENLIERANATEIIRSIKGIPFLIQAIQYSLESAYVVPTNDSTETAPTQTDSAIESTTTNHDFYVKIGDDTIGEIHLPPSSQHDIDPSQHHQKKTSTGGDRRKSQHSPRRRLADLKRQSIFVVFPYSETSPIDQSKLRMRRSSSDHELDRKSSFEQFCAAVISGQPRRASKLSSSEGRLETAETEHHRGNDDEHRGSASNVKRSDVRRPSLEVRYVGLQSILVAKMTAKQAHEK